MSLRVPTPTVTASPVTVTVNEGQTAVASGAWGDPGADMVTLAASAGTAYSTEVPLVAHLNANTAPGTLILNAAHPFREGNGRTQREFVRELGRNAGHRIDWRATAREKMTQASQVSHATGDASLFAALIRVCMTS